MARLPGLPDWLKRDLDRAAAEGRIVQDSGVNLPAGSAGPGSGVPNPAADESEAAFLTRVLAVAKAEGWHSFHQRPAWLRDGKMVSAVQGDGKGFPDLVLVRERVVYAELKSAAGCLGPHQKVWRDKLLAAGQEYYCWKPTDWPEILQVLGPVRDAGTLRRSRSG